ncbi:MAG: hypothetical protein WAX89_04650 [Alphaproteobacteria bacterium]
MTGKGFFRNLRQWQEDRTPVQVKLLTTGETIVGTVHDYSHGHVDIAPQGATKPTSIHYGNVQSIGPLA